MLSRYDCVNPNLFARWLLGDLLEFASLPVFQDTIPRKAFAVHGNVNTGRQHLDERERATQIKEAVGAAKGVGNHRAGENDGFSRNRARNRRGGFGHGVGAMGNDDAILLRAEAILHDERAIGIGHLQAVEHHDGADGHVDPRTSEPEHLGDVGVLKKELPGLLVVFLIKGAAGDEDSDGHGNVARSALKLESGERGARSSGWKLRVRGQGLENAERRTATINGLTIRRFTCPRRTLARRRERIDAKRNYRRLPCFHNAWLASALFSLSLA